jgi:2',3'-cyclic-nucleotide 2'-phosphodiesterase (5'-nucleotidase family)
MIPVVGPAVPVLPRALPVALLLAACASATAPGAEAPAPRAAEAARPITLSVVSTNDLHGRIQALPRIGGFVANLRRAREADGGGTLLLDSGDMFQGELASNLTEGAAVVDAYNLLGYAAAAVGNHEFDLGPVGPASFPRPGDDPRGALLARAAQAKYPLLAANLIDTRTGHPFTAPNLVPSTIREVAGVKVGLVGALTLETTQSVLASVFAGLELAPLAASIAREAERVRAGGATVVIVVAHAGGECKRFENPDDLSSCDAGAEIFGVANAPPEGGLQARRRPRRST